MAANPADVCLFAPEPNPADVRLRDMGQCGVIQPVTPPPAVPGFPPIKGIGYAPWRWGSHVG
jgi:hypothetical protein